MLVQIKNGGDYCVQNNEGYKTEDKVIIDCLVENMDFVNAKLFQIIDENQKSFVTKKFEIDKPRSCFSVSKCIWVILKSDVPDSFLKVGNEICFL